VKTVFLVLTIVGFLFWVSSLMPFVGSGSSGGYFAGATVALLGYALMTALETFTKK
jgi:hypothetical protein